MMIEEHTRQLRIAERITLLLTGGVLATALYVGVTGTLQDKPNTALRSGLLFGTAGIAFGFNRMLRSTRRELEKPSPHDAFEQHIHDILEQLARQQRGQARQAQATASDAVVGQDGEVLFEAPLTRTLPKQSAAPHGTRP